MSAAEQTRTQPTVLESERLRLRHVGDDDAPFILGLLNDPGWLRYIGDRGVRTLDDARRYVAEGPRRMYADHGYGLFLVERKDDGVPLGLCGLIRRDTLPDVDIGFALASKFRGQGYAFEAAAATLRYAREVHKLTRVVAIAMPENVASNRLLQRLGLRFERTIEFGPDERRETLNYYGTTAAFAMDAENVHAVDESLWTSGQLSVEDIGRLPALGVEAVVNLALPTSSNAVPGEADAVTALGVSYVQIPVPWERPALGHLQQFFGVMDAFAGRKVWVHCAKNMRVSAFVYLYRRLRRGEPEQAARHPMADVWEPNETWRAFIDAALREHASG
ncbi:MAG TPA: GNAT family N-acetyltransferase [Steroidobacteraceae bacterium]|nr:GNAT family N-acetyltransferase [Steroidobacteraceae bacterium]